MTTEVYIIDPDVWKGSSSDPRCSVAVLDVWQKPQRQLALDGGQIEKEYVGLLASSSLPSDLAKLLQNIFNQRERSNKIKVVNPIKLPELEQLIQQLNCTTPVEPEMIRTAAAINGGMAKLLVIGEDRIRRRGLHQNCATRKLRHFFRTNLNKGVDVVYASRIGLPGRNERVLAYERRVFEDQVRTILAEKIYQVFGHLPRSRKPTPPQVEAHQDSSGKRAGEVDVYLYVDVAGTRYVWICECELREAGNEGKPTSKQKVLKLRRKIEAVEAFEQAPGRTVVLKAYMVTNATTCAPAARRIMAGCDIQYCQVKMPKDWTTNYRWCLADNNIQGLIV